MDDRKHVVAAGYDAMAEAFLAWGARVEGDPRERFAADFARLLPEDAQVADLGCGAGVPSTRALAKRFAVVGVDISAEQLRLARRHVPSGAFVRADLATLPFAGASFDGVTAFYSISHVPREEHAGLFAGLARILRPGGVLLAVLGATSSADWTGEWLGVPMFFSSFDADTNRGLLRSAGFELLRDDVVEIREPEGPVRFLWVLARRG